MGILSALWGQITHPGGYTTGGGTSPSTPLPPGVSNSTPTGGTIGGTPASPFNGPVIESGPSYNATGAGLPTLASQTPSTSPVSAPPPPLPAGPGGGGSAAAPTYGTESDPGILQQWFGERANGTDPGYEYATGRGLTDINNQEAARGGFDSGAGLQQDSDYLANMGSQREGQLDALATGASGERANQLSTMLGFGTGLAGAEAGLGSAYDLGGANAMSGANNTGLGYGAQAIALPYQANQNFLSNLMKL